MPTTLSTLEACQSLMSIYILPPSFLPPRLPLSLSHTHTGLGKPPNRKHWRNKKAARSRSGMIYGPGPSLGGAEREGRRFTTPVGCAAAAAADTDNAGEVARLLLLRLLMSCKRLRPPEKRPRKNVPREQEKQEEEEGGHANIFEVGRETRAKNKGTPTDRPSNRPPFPRVVGRSERGIGLIQREGEVSPNEIFVAGGTVLKVVAAVTTAL